MELMVEADDVVNKSGNSVSPSSTLDLLASLPLAPDPTPARRTEAASTQHILRIDEGGLAVVSSGASALWDEDRMRDEVTLPNSDTRLALQSGYRGRGSGAAKGAKKAGKSELTEEQKQEIREAFDLFDTDGSGAHDTGL